MGNIPTNKLGTHIVYTILGAGFILAGILLLIGGYVGIEIEFDFWRNTWPLAIITPGLLLFLASFAFENRIGLTLAIFGWMVATTGTILLIQNAFDWFASWAYAWALVVPASIGIGKLVYGSVRGIRGQVRKGLNLIGLGLSIFLFGGIFFEGIIGISGFRFGTAWQCWPAMLIGPGIILMLSNLLPRRNRPLTNITGEIGVENE